VRTFGIPVAFSLVIVTTVLINATPAYALMAGTSPDSPTARIDPNTMSSPWAGVGSMSVSGNTFSGTLIDRRYVLTAAHVVAGASTGSIQFNLNYGGDLTQRIGVTAIFINPQYTGFGNGDLGSDLALVQLAEPIPDGVPIYGIYRDVLPINKKITLVGYGASGNGDVGATIGGQAHIKRTGQNKVDQLIAGGGTGTPLSVYFYDFDGPTLSSNLTGGKTLGNTLETTVASGDSGGPSFAQGQHGEWLIAGVNTFTTLPSVSMTRSTFGTGGGGALLSAQIGWIDNIIATPVPEPSTASLLLVGALSLSGIAAWRRNSNSAN